LKPGSLNLETPSTPQPIETQVETPLWLHRLCVIVFVLFCIELGTVLVVLPWSSWWFNNNLLAHWPSIRHFWQLGFVRGAVSGLGFLDFWLGVSEAIHYRDRR
jgi:hypothetical protein